MKLKLAKDAYDPDALVGAGVHPSIVSTLMADGPAAVPMKARRSITGRGRTEPTTHYVWGPDAMTLLNEETQR